jgi:ABC-type multidrug transport system fused ATPase/permease subunit
LFGFGLLQWLYEGTLAATKDIKAFTSYVVILLYSSEIAIFGLIIGLYAVLAGDTHKKGKRLQEQYDQEKSKENSNTESFIRAEQEVDLRTEAQLAAIEAKRNQPAQPMNDPVDEED